MIVEVSESVDVVAVASVTVSQSLWTEVGTYVSVAVTSSVFVAEMVSV